MKSQSILVLVMAVLLFGPVPSAFATTASFQGLGYLVEGDYSSSADAISGDGLVVAGTSYSPSADFKVFRWTANEGMINLGFGSTNGISANGSTVVGSSGGEAFRWTQMTGMVGLGDLPGGNFSSRAMAASADGQVVVGYGHPESGTEAFRWTEQTGMVGIGDFPGGIVQGYAYDVSADGSVVVGRSWAENGSQAFRWTLNNPATGAGTMVSIGTLGGDLSGAEGVSADGSVVVGWADSTFNRQSFRWTQSTGMVGLGPGRATDVSADGSVIVGYGSALGSFIWYETNGMRDLYTVLVNQYGLDLTGWTLSSAKGISDDGLTIVGYGNNPDGYTEAWIATIPEPATFLLFGLGGLALMRNRRFR